MGDRVAASKAALDAVVDMWTTLTWLDRQRRGGRPLFRRDRAIELLEPLPTGECLADAGALFLEAEETSASEGLLHIAVGLMLRSEGAAIDGDAYRCAIADGAYRDPEVWQCYEPGFSAPVVETSGPCSISATRPKMPLKKLRSVLHAMLEEATG
jgi:hypothetical protein